MRAPRNHISDNKLSIFKDAMRKGKAFEKKRHYVNSYMYYKKAVSIFPDNLDAKSSMKRVGKILADRHYEKALFYLNKGWIKKAKKELYIALKYYPEHKKARDLINKPNPNPISTNRKKVKRYTIKSGNTLSDVAMKFYGTYKTLVYYPPVDKKIMVSKILELHNNVTPEKLYVGQIIELPELEGIPFIGESGSPDERKTPKKDKAKPPKHVPEVLHPKTEITDKIIIPEQVKKGLRYYCKADFYKAKEIFRKYLEYEGNEKWLVIPLAYLALVENAYGKDDAVQKAIEKLLEINPTMDISDVSEIYPPFKEDLPPEFIQRFKKIQSSYLQKLK